MVQIARQDRMVSYMTWEQETTRFRWPQHRHGYAVFSVDGLWLVIRWEALEFQQFLLSGMQFESRLREVKQTRSGMTGWRWWSSWHGSRCGSINWDNQTIGFQQIDEQSSFPIWVYETGNFEPFDQCVLGEKSINWVQRVVADISWSLNKRKLKGKRRDN